MDKTKWIIFAVVCVGLLGGLIYFNSSEKAEVSNVNSAGVISGEEDGTYADNVYGNAESSVVLVEYGDFQCPACASAAGAVGSLKQEYKDDIAFVYRHFPLTSIHPNALATATVSEAAANQGKFWEMHDLLFERQSQWESVDASERGTLFEQYADQLGLDVETFKEDIQSDEIANKINFQRSVASNDGVSATPTFFLNGEQVSSEVISNLTSGDGSQLREQIDSLIEK